MKGFVLGLVMVCSTASAENLLPKGGTNEIVIPKNATVTCSCYDGKKSWTVEAKQSDDCMKVCNKGGLPVIDDLMGLFE